MKVETAQLHAIAAAAYVDETLVGLDPFSIITIFTTVLPIIQQLFGMCGRGDDPAKFIVPAAWTDRRDAEERANGFDVVAGEEATQPAQRQAGVLHGRD